MVITPTPEMNELEKLFAPYAVNKNRLILKPDAPQKAIDAVNKYKSMWKKIYDDAVQEYCT